VLVLMVFMKVNFLPSALTLACPHIDMIYEDI